MESKKEKNNNNIIVFILLGILLVCILCVVLFIHNGKGKDGDNKNNTEEQEKFVPKEYNEQELIDAYGMSIAEAEDLVMSYYHSDNFEPHTTINGTHYKVIVKDLISGDEHEFDVNPASGEYSRVK